jgi:hypothetical protein
LAGISNTDWSWSALFADYDNDGWKDLYVTNGYLRDYTNLDFLKYMGDYVQNNQSSIQRENVLELVQKMPAFNVHNYMFKNQPGDAFKSVTTPWGLDRASNSNGAAYADSGQDGDLELIVNNINQAAFIYENKSVQLKKRPPLYRCGIFRNGRKYPWFGGESLGVSTRESPIFRTKSISRISIQRFPRHAHRPWKKFHHRFASGRLEFRKTEILKKLASNKRLQLKESNAHESWSYAQPLTPIFLKNKVFLATNFASLDPE